MTLIYMTGMKLTKVKEKGELPAFTVILNLTF